MVIEGDSIAAQPAFGYWYQARNNVAPTVQTNIAIGGSRLDTNGPSGDNPGDLTFRATTYTDKRLPVGLSGLTKIFYVAIGANDVWPSGENFAVRVGEYCQARRAAGWDKIVVATVLPRTDIDYVDQEPRRLVYNDIIRTGAWQTTYGVDAVCDLGGHAIMGDIDSFDTNPEYWQDEVHPNAAGHALLEPIYTATINSL